jgi:flagellar biosynthesis/type III secretory pathway M-ring protein FliF/YscJ
MMAAWLWVKKYWQWLVGGLLLVLGFFFGVSVKKRPVITGENPERKDIENEKQKKENALEVQASEARESLAKKYDEEISRNIRLQADTHDDLEEDLKKTNEYLKNAGDLVRGGKNE